MTVVDRPSLARPRIVGSPSGTDGEAHPLERHEDGTERRDAARRASKWGVDERG